MLTRRTLFQSCVAASVASIPTLARAAPKAIRILVGYPAGGGIDVIARLLADDMRGRSGGTVIVENRPGAGGRLALDATKRSDPDGSTIVLTPDFPLTVFPHLYRKLPYDPLADFAPVAVCGTSDFALSVGPAVPQEINTVEQFIRWCRENPRLALYGSPAPGSTPHFTGVLLARAASVELTHVAYKGGAQAIQDLLGGQVPGSINPIAEVLPHVSGTRLRVLATTGQSRSRFLANTPTLAENGFKGVVVQSWIGVLAPAGTPRAALGALERSVADALKTPSVIESIRKFGIETSAVSGEQFAALLRQDLARWAPIVKTSGFSAEE